MEKTMSTIKEDLRFFIGSEMIYHGMIKNSCYTEGFKAYLEACSCYWLYDIIQTEFLNAVRKHSPDTYYITVNTLKSKTTILLQDWEDKQIYTRVIDVTTHPEGEIEFHFGWDGQRAIICLSSEN